MGVNTISVACDDVERLYIFDCSRELEADATHSEASCTSGGAEGCLT